MDFIISVATEAAGELLAATRECTKQHTQWRCVHCTACGEDYVYEQAIRATASASDPFLLKGRRAQRTAARRAALALAQRVHELSNEKSGVYCPACGSFESEHNEEAIDAIAEKKMYRVMYVCIGMIFASLALLPIWIAIVALSVHVFELSRADILFDGGVDVTLILIGLSCVPFFLSPLIQYWYTPRNINSAEMKAERLASSDRYAWRRDDFIQLAPALTEGQRAAIAAATGWTAA